MGRQKAELTYAAPPSRRVESLGFIRRHKPRIYEEWKALYDWNQLPSWESPVAGYLLRAARERANLTQEELGQRLGCSQPAVAQAERWSSNPTVAFLRRWANACAMQLQIGWKR